VSTYGRIALWCGLLVFLQPALADPVVIEVPGEKWRLKFDGPAFAQIEVPKTTRGHVYTGNAGRFNLSLHVEAPYCEGGDSARNLFKCFAGRLQSNPYLVIDTMKVRSAADGVQVTYVVEAPLGGKKVAAFNLNYLFARDGKWADLHISAVDFSREDLEAVTAMLSSLEFVESTQ